MATRFLDAAASDWTKPAFDDPGMSERVTTFYKPAQDEDEGEYSVRWYGTLKGPDDTDKPYLAMPLEDDFDSLAQARAAVEKAFKKKQR